MLSLCGLNEGAIDTICKDLEYKGELNELGGEQLSSDGVYALSLPNI